MTRKEQAKEILDRKLKEIENKKKFENEKELEQDIAAVAAQIHKVQEVSLINTIEMNAYLSRLEEKYLKVLHTEQFKEYREQVINGDDDYLSYRERLFHYAKLERDNITRSRAQWEEALSGSDTSGNNSHSGRNEILKSVAEEREEIREDIK